MKRLIVGVGLGTVCVLLLMAGAQAQGVGASGGISGTIVDPSGALVPNGAAPNRPYRQCRALSLHIPAPLHLQRYRAGVWV
jgi:hypothetical protein